MLNLATPKEAKSVRFSESRLEIPLNLAAETKTSVLTEKSGSMNPFLKRKTFEVLYIADFSVRSVMMRNMHSNYF